MLFLLLLFWFWFWFFCCISVQLLNFKNGNESVDDEIQIPLVGVIFDSEGDFGLSLYDDTESINFYKKVALKNNVCKSYLVLKSKIC